MRFLVPFAEVNPQAIAAAPAGSVFVDVSDSPVAYWEVLGEWWADGEDFAVLEHDVVCHGSVAEQFDACPEPWCVFGYDNMCHEECREAWANMLGCTRFRKELIAAIPNAVSSIPPELRDWHNLCDHLAGDKINGTPSPLRPGSVRDAGFTHHWHVPHVGHHPWFTCR